MITSTNLHMWIKFGIKERAAKVKVTLIHEIFSDEVSHIYGI